jgi:hypothetical protein
MKTNESLQLSVSFREALSQDLSSSFIELYPKELVSNYIIDNGLKVRNTIFTLENTLLTMLLTAQHEDKSLQQSVNLFKVHYEKESLKIQDAEKKQIDKAKKAKSMSQIKKAGRPPEFKSKLSKSITKEISAATAAYSIARKRLPFDLIKTLFDHVSAFDDLEKEQWYGMNTYIADGTYLQLQDNKEIRGKYPVLKGEGNYPQALLEVLIRQGSGQIVNYSIAGRRTSELTLIQTILKQLPASSLLLADDLYNTYYNFCLIQEQHLHIIVPGKRDRNFKVIEQISDSDCIVEINKPKTKPKTVSKEAWVKLPKTIILRRIEYEYPTKNGIEKAILYTTILDKSIRETAIVEKYEKRWDIEICIREIKTLMDINILRGKSSDMLEKELLVALIAYNLIRRIISMSAQKADISPQRDIFQECFTTNRAVFTDKRGRVFCKKSTGRPRNFT